MVADFSWAWAEHPSTVRRAAARRLLARRFLNSMIPPFDGSVVCRTLKVVLNESSARHMQDRVGFVRLLLQCLDRLNSGKDEQMDLASLGFGLHFFHHGQSAVCPGADNEALAFPRYLLLHGQWRVSEGVAEFFRRLFLALVDLAAIDHHVVFVGAAIDLDGAERETIDAH